MSVSSDHVTETWKEIQGAVESLSSLARQEVSPDHFYGELVTCVCQLTSAAHCGIWVREATPNVEVEPERPEPQRWIRLKQAVRNESPDQASQIRDHRCYAQLIGEAAENANHTALDAGFVMDGDANLRLAHDTVLERVTIGRESVSVLELGHDPGRSPSQWEGSQHLLNVAVEIASDFERNWQLRQLWDREQRREKLDRFLQQIHQSYDLRRVAYAIVAGGKELVDCDRLSLVLKTTWRCRVAAVSGVHQPDHRSPTVRCLQQLAKAHLGEHDSQSFDPQWFDPSSPAAESGPLKRYFAETSAKRVGLLPLFSTEDSKRKPERIGTLLVEVFEEPSIASDGLLKSRANWVVRHASNALSNAVRLNRLPMLAVSRWIDRHLTRGRRIPWGLLSIAASCVLLWYLAWMPTDFRIEARGELVPVTRESIYAPRSGTVIGFPAISDADLSRDDAQGTTVKPGDTVVRLENSELEYELTTLLGEQATVDQQLETIAASIGQFGRSRDQESRDRYDELTAQSAELKVKQESLARRIRLVNREREKLAIKATLGGQILTWDVVNSLMLRPVQQGDLLLEVVDVNGPWEIDLYVRDRHIGYVKAAQRASDDPLSLSFVHRSDPEREYQATVKSIALSTEVYPEYGSAVRVIGKLSSPKQFDALRPGTTVIAKLDCGKKPLAYVLGYDLLHTLRMWMLF